MLGNFVGYYNAKLLSGALQRNKIENTENNKAVQYV